MGAEMPCVSSSFLDETFKMYVFWLFRFLGSPVCDRVLRCLAFFVKFFLDEAFKMHVLVSFPPQPDLRSGAEMPCVSLRFLDVTFKMYVFWLFRFLRSPVCDRVPRCLAFFVKFFLTRRLRCTLFVSFLRVSRCLAFFRQVFLDEAFKMRVLVLFPPQPDLRSGAEMPCVSLRFLDEKFKMYVLFGCFVPSVAQS